MSYTLLILVRNIVAGIDGVPASVREAAVAMGFRRWRMFATVEVPIALPVIIAGVRIATVTTVGLVTVTALIGQGGYGAFINDGLQRFFNTPLILGAALSVAARRHARRPVGPGRAGVDAVGAAKGGVMEFLGDVVDVVHDYRALARDRRDRATA